MSAPEIRIVGSNTHFEFRPGSRMGSKASEHPDIDGLLMLTLAVPDYTHTIALTGDREAIVDTLRRALLAASEVVFRPQPEPDPETGVVSAALVDAPMPEVI